MRNFMTEIKMVNVAEAIAKERKGEDFTSAYYDRLRKYYHLPTLGFARKHGIIKVTSSETFDIVRHGETITTKRYFYGLDKDKYKEIMSFVNTRAGLRRRLKECSLKMRDNNGKIEMLTGYNSEMETFLYLVGQW